MAVFVSERSIAAPVSAWSIRQTIYARRKRDEHFPGIAFHDPAWDILLDLYAAHLERRRVSVTSLAIAASVPKATAFRWISRLIKSGILVCEPDPHDGRRLFVSLSGASLERMHSYFLSTPTTGEKR